MTNQELIRLLKANSYKRIALDNDTGEPTEIYTYRKLAKFDIRLSVIARGISVGGELEYTDEVTLGRSIINRQPFDGRQ